MIDSKTQLKVQALLDGELPEREARRLAERIAEDAEAQALLAELKGTQKALADFEGLLRLPESREFFWSKIERAIQAQPERIPAEMPVWADWRRFFVPAASVAALALAALVAVLGPERGRGPQFEAALNDPGAFTYRDDSAGATLVWLSYPADNEFAEDEPADTIE